MTRFATKCKRPSIVVRLGALAVVLALAIGQGPGAQAFLVAGACTLDVTFTFDGVPTLPGVGGPPYSISVDQSNSDCTLHDASWTSTNASGEANEENSLVQCGILAGNGGWDQLWQEEGLALVDGFHVVAGTWVGAIMLLTGFPENEIERFNSVVLLTPHPDEPFANAKKTAKCAKGEAISSIRMLGVQVFVDPPDEDDFQL